MKIHRFIGDFDLANKSLVIDDKELAHQITRVLGLKIGEQIVLGDGQGKEVRAEIVEIKKDFVKVSVLEVRKNENEPEREVVLCCAILKRENFELVVQKATEIGVKVVVPLLTARTVKTNLNYERLNKIIKEAAEQSGRGIVSELKEAVVLKQALVDCENVKTKLFFDGNGYNSLQPLSLKRGAKSIAVFIGPEGGWTEEELNLAKENNCEVVSLGKTTLRGETAAIVASYLAVNF